MKNPDISATFAFMEFNNQIEERHATNCDASEEGTNEGGAVSLEYTEASMSSPQEEVEGSSATKLLPSSLHHPPTVESTAEADASLSSPPQMESTQKETLLNEGINEDHIFACVEGFLPALSQSFPVVYQALYLYEQVRKQWNAKWNAKDEELSHCIRAGQEVLEQFNAVLAKVGEKTLEESSVPKKRVKPSKRRSQGSCGGVTTGGEYRKSQEKPSGRTEKNTALNRFLQMLREEDVLEDGRKGGEEERDRSQPRQTPRMPLPNPFSFASSPTPSPELLAMATLMPTVYRRLGSVWENTHALVKTCRAAVQQLEEEEEAHLRKQSAEDASESTHRIPNGSLLQDRHPGGSPSLSSPHLLSSAITPAGNAATSSIPSSPQMTPLPPLPLPPGRVPRPHSWCPEDGVKSSFVDASCSSSSASSLSNWLYQVTELLVSSLSFLQEVVPQELKPLCTELYVNYRHTRQEVWMLRGQLHDTERDKKRLEVKAQKANEDCAEAEKGLEVVLQRVQQWYLEQQKNVRDGHTSMDSGLKHLRTLLLNPLASVSTSQGASALLSTVPSTEEVRADSTLYTVQQETLEATVLAAEKALKEQEENLAKAHQLALHHLQQRLNDRERELEVVRQANVESSVRERTLASRLRDAEKAIKEEEAVQLQLHQDIERGQTLLVAERERWSKKQEEAMRIIQVLQPSPEKTNENRLCRGGMSWTVAGGTTSNGDFPPFSSASSAGGERILELYQSSETQNHRLQEEMFVLRKKVVSLSEELAQSGHLLHEKEESKEKMHDLLQELEAKQKEMKEELMEKDVRMKSFEEQVVQQKQVIQDHLEALHASRVKGAKDRKEAECRAKVDLRRVEELETQLRQEKEEKVQLLSQHQTQKQKYTEQQEKWKLIAQRLKEEKRSAEEQWNASKRERESEASQREHIALLQKKEIERSAAAQRKLAHRVQELEDILQEVMEEKQLTSTSVKAVQERAHKQEQQTKEVLKQLEEQVRSLERQREEAVLSATAAEGEVSKLQRELEEASTVLAHEKKNTQKVGCEKEIASPVVAVASASGVSQGEESVEYLEPNPAESLVSSPFLDALQDQKKAGVWEVEKDLRATLQEVQQSLIEEKRENIQLRVLLQSLHSEKIEEKTQLQVEQLKRAQAEETMEYYKNQWSTACSALETMRQKWKEPQHHKGGVFHEATPMTKNMEEKGRIIAEEVEREELERQSEPVLSTAGAEESTENGQHQRRNDGHTDTSSRIIQCNLQKGVEALLRGVARRERLVLEQLHVWLREVREGLHHLDLEREAKKEEVQARTTVEGMQGSEKDTTNGAPKVHLLLLSVLQQVQDSVLREVELAITSTAAAQDLQWENFWTTWYHASGDEMHHAIHSSSTNEVGKKPTGSPLTFSSPFFQVFYWTQLAKQCFSENTSETEKSGGSHEVGVQEQNLEPQKLLCEKKGKEKYLRVPTDAVATRLKLQQSALVQKMELTLLSHNTPTSVTAHSRTNVPNGKEDDSPHPLREPNAKVMTHSIHQKWDEEAEQREHCIRDLEKKLLRTQMERDQMTKVLHERDEMASLREEEFRSALKILQRQCAEEGIEHHREKIDGVARILEVESSVKDFCRHFSTDVVRQQLTSAQHVLSLKREQDDLLREEVNALRRTNEEVERRLQQAEEDRSRMRLQLYDLLNATPSKRLLYEKAK